MRVEHDHGVVVERLELLRPDLVEGGDQRDLLALVELEARRLGQHDRGDVREQTRTDDLTHVSSIPSVRKRCS